MEEIKTTNSAHGAYHHRFFRTTYGETGTGKEQAESIHTASAWENVKAFCITKPCSKFRCLLVFYLERKRKHISGAENKLPDCLNGERRRTLFLDEINSMEPNVQAKILKVVEEKQVVWLGGYGVDFKTDIIKVISAVNERDRWIMWKQVNCVRGSFYRLSVVQVIVSTSEELEETIFIHGKRFIGNIQSKDNVRISIINDGR